LYRLRADRDECPEETPDDGVLDLELGLEVRSVSVTGGCGDLDGRELWDICEGERDEEGNDDSDVRRVGNCCPFAFE
jgi:hypothetical protein